MAIYKLSFWPEESAYVRAESIQFLPLFDGNFIEAEHKMPVLKLYDGERNDFLDFWPGSPLVCDKAFRFISEEFRKEVQFFPVSVDGLREQYWILNCTNVVDCLDVERSEIKYRKLDGGISKIKNYVFHEDMVESFGIFKIPQTVRIEVFATEKFARTCSENALSGVIFNPV